ncbi:hypothetical protein P3T22_003630 [Paraburkholderia sp. GAS348]
MTTVRRGAPACVLRPDVFIQRIVSGEQIFSEQFFTGSDRPERVDENAAIVFNGLAVGRARVIEPARAVAAAAVVDHAAIRHSEKKRMSFDAFTLVTTHRISPRSDFAFVLKNALAGCKRPRCEHTLAVN